MVLSILLFLTQVQVPTATIGSSLPVARVELPTNLYALEGQTLNVYFRNVVRYEGVWTDVTNSVTCSKGSQDISHWTYLPTSGDAGTNTFVFKVWNRATGTEITSTTCSLITRALAYPASPVSRRVLLIGDSTSASGQPSAELIRLFSGDSQYTFAEVGSNDGTVNDSIATPRSVVCEAIPGGSFQMFNTDTTVSWTTINGAARTGSPFVTNGVFSFNYYLTNNSITLSSGDWVIFNLGLNSIGPSGDDSTLNTNIANELSALANMISSIQSAVSGIRIGVAVTIPPNESIAAFQTDYGASTAWIYRYLRNHQLWVERLVAEYDGTHSGIFMVPIHANLDCVNNMANAVHPASAGYWKIASSYQIFLKGTE